MGHGEALSPSLVMFQCHLILDCHTGHECPRACPMALPFTRANVAQVEGVGEAYAFQHPVRNRRNLRGCAMVGDALVGALA